MIDPDSRAGRELKAAEEFFALAKTAPSPFMRSYYQRVAERYLSSQGELKPVIKTERCSRRHSYSAGDGATADARASDQRSEGEGFGGVTCRAI